MTFSQLSTKELFDKFVSSGLMVDRDLIEEIIKRKDSSNYLFGVMQDDEYWELGNKGDGWAPIHGIFIAGLIANSRAFDVLNYVLRHRVEELGDWITEDVARILFSFGKEFFDKIGEIALDKSFNIYVRLAAIDAACALSIVNNDLKFKVVEICKKILDENNDELISLALPNMSEVKDDDLFDIIKQVYKTSAGANDVTDLEDLEKLHAGKSDTPEYTRCLGTLWDHFSFKEMNRLRQINYRTNHEYKKIKIGRNDPCPCGSGKKYKKCCLEI